MADNSLKAISNSISSIASHQEVIDKNVKDIRDAVCGSDSIHAILNSINDQINVVTKKGLLSKLDGRGMGSRDRFQRKLTRSTDSIITILSKIFARIQKMGGGKGAGKLDLKQDKGKDKKLNTMAQSLEIVSRLRDIKMKDFILAKTKMKHISNLMMKFKGMFSKFKDKKEMEATLNFASTSIEIVKKLSKMAILAIPAKIGLKTVERIFLGGKKGGGLLEIFRNVHLHRKEIKDGKKSMNQILAATGAMFLTTILLASMVVTGIPAMIGAGMMYVVTWLLSKTFAMLNKAKKNALIGSVVLLIMSASLITFALGLGFMVKAVKDMDWGDFGKMMASIVALSLVMGIIGITPINGFVMAGSIVLLAMGASLLVFGLGLGKTVDAVKGMNWGDFGMMLANIAALGATLAGLAFVSPFILAGSAALLAAGGSLLLFGKSIKEWNKINNVEPAVTNIKTTITEIREAIKGRFDMKAVRQIGRIGRHLKRLYKGIKDWDKFDGVKASENIGITITALQDVFKTQIDKKAVNSYGRVGRILKRLFKGVKYWEGFDSSSAIASITTAVSGLFSIFGLSNNQQNQISQVTSGGVLGALKSIGGSIHNTFNAISNNINNAIHNNGVKRTMDSLNVVMSSLNSVRNYLASWISFDASQGVNNIRTAVNGLLSQYALIRLHSNTVRRTVNSINSLDMSKATIMIDLFKSFSKIGNKSFDKFTNAVTIFSNSCNDLIEALEKYGIKVTASTETETTSANTTSGENIGINNVQDLAEAIANAIQSLPVNVHTDISDINLVVNGEAGRKVVLTLDN